MTFVSLSNSISSFRLGISSKKLLIVLFLVVVVDGVVADEFEFLSLSSLGWISENFDGLPSDSTVKLLSMFWGVLESSISLGI